MKKTLIALAVAASAAVSGSAMAWTANGTGGSVDMGGTLNPVDKVTPWEVKTGAAVTGLDADIVKGQSSVDISVTNAIPVLGIRTVKAEAFQGRVGINPKIDFNGAVDFSNAKDGLAKLTLNVLNNSDAKIGNLQADIFTGVGIARNDAAGGDAYSAYNNNTSFVGGIGNSDQVIGSLKSLKSKANAIDPEFAANFYQMDKPDIGKWRAPDMSNESHYFSAFYASGIEQGKVLKITLDSPAQGDNAIVWKASLPVTVSYE